MSPPTCAYRFQFTPHDDFEVAAEIVPYLKSIGVSHLYLSPIGEAEPGSTHGYDIVDPSRIRAELGGEDGFANLIRALERHHMGWILDIVPNHLSSATPEANPWFWDVLRNGQESVHARSFDIDWTAGEGKVLMPVLDRPLEEALSGGISVVPGADGSPALQVPSGLRLPLRPDCEPASTPLAVLIGEQHYRLAPWRSTHRNVRRFFEIDSLVAVAVENPEVRDRRHELLLRLLEDYPSMSGVRVDHVDGLADPDGYLRWLRNLIGPDRLLLVEKILLGAEQLPPRWPVDGTTGYEFARLVDRLLLNAGGFESVVTHYVELTDDRRDFEEIEAHAIDQVLRDRLAPDVARVARRVSVYPALQGDRGVQAVVRLAGSFRRYRTYLPEGAESDRQVLADASTRAALGRSSGEVESIEALTAVLAAPTSEEERKALALFQQLTGPALAKGIEDRAVYRYLPLAALNEVGGSATGPPASAAEFHRWATTAAEHSPRAMLTTSTHDTKRSGDLRARLLTLSDRPDLWRSFCDRWIDFGADRLAVHRIDRYLVLQHTVGAWPISSDRLVEYARKALREAAERTSWIHVDEAYESAVEGLIGSLLANDDFCRSVERFVQHLAPASLARSLTQVLLRLTSPGFGDLYRGDEVLDLALVDPDNRRHIGWGALADLVVRARSVDVAEAIEVSPSLAKMSLIVRTLRARSGAANGSDYEPLGLTGLPLDGDALAFRRGNLVAVVAHRVPEDRWHSVELVLPPGEWIDVLVDRRAPLIGTVSLDQIVDARLPLRLFGRR
jgi:(1->4)-alpha-D-glucan 1-alpha-D-glucosylmutase